MANNNALHIVEPTSSLDEAVEGQNNNNLILPHNSEAEQVLLANLINDNLAFEHVSDFLKPEHFSDPILGKIYKAITTLIERGQIVDAVTLRDFFIRDDELSNIGGIDFLAQLASAVISIGNTRDYAKLIYELHLRRQLIHLGHHIVDKANQANYDHPPTQQIEDAEQFLYDLTTKGNFDRNFTDFSKALANSIEIADKAYKRESKIVGVTSGLSKLDLWLGGLHPSDLIIIAGRPSMGKTALVTNIAFNACKATLRRQKEGAVTAFFSLEMSAEQLATRILSSESGVISDKIRRGELTDPDFNKFYDVARELATLPLYIDDTPALTMSALRTRARRLKRKENLGLIVIDYLQLIQSANSRRHDNRVQELSEITRGLKALAKELNVPVIACSQLSRAVESRDDKRPQLADLRESGSIEQDADVVMFIYRQAYYEQRKEPERDTDKHREWQARVAKINNIADLIIAKQRHGPVGTLSLYYDIQLTKFRDLAKDEELANVR
jgi:replicative DNA helicase